VKSRGDLVPEWHSHREQSARELERSTVRKGDMRASKRSPVDGFGGGIAPATLIAVAGRFSI
jgi:hypothetical protein